MEGQEYKLKTGKYTGIMLKDVPVNYLLKGLEKGWLEDVARRFVIANQHELRNKLKMRNNANDLSIQ